MNKFSKKNKAFVLSRLVLVAAVQNLWHERNRRIFENKELHKVMVFRRLYEDIYVLQTCNRKVEIMLM